MRNGFVYSSFLISFLLFSVRGLAQEFTFSSFDKEILNYSPKKGNGVTDKSYKYGLFILEKTIEATEGESENLNFTDYWNLTTALMSVGADKADIEIAFKKAIEIKNQSICEYIQSIPKNGFEDVIPELYSKELIRCKGNIEKKEIFDVEKYITQNKLDSDLVLLMIKIDQRDTKYRKEEETDWSLQTPFDKQNQKSIDSLFSVYKEYIGNTRVGDKFEDSMWLVVQHSNVKMMERYLPIIQKAIKTKKLSSNNPLKYLVDRVYHAKYGYQIFGSQQGVKIADDETCKRVRKLYGL